MQDETVFPADEPGNISNTLTLFDPCIASKSLPCDLNLKLLHLSERIMGTFHRDPARLTLKL